MAPGVGEGFSATGKGGFQQLEVNELMMKNIKRTDDLRVADNPKLSYKMPVVPGQQFIGKSMDTPGEVRKYRPDTFYVAWWPLNALPLLDSNIDLSIFRTLMKSMTETDCPIDFLESSDTHRRLCTITNNITRASEK